MSPSPHIQYECEDRDRDHSREDHDEWAVAERRYLSEESMAKIGEPVVTVEEVPIAITA